jgi:hypothetical protein
MTTNGGRSSRRVSLRGWALSRKATARGSIQKKGVFECHGSKGRVFG